MFSLSLASKKYLLYAGLAIAPIVYLAWNIYRDRMVPKRRLFDKKIGQLRKLIEKASVNAENIFPLTRVKTARIKDDKINLTMEIHLVENLAKKNRLNTASSFQKDNIFLPPFEKGIFICDIGNHRLIFNKFPLIKKHILVISKRFEDQQSRLKKEDFASTFLAMLALKGVAIYNSGPDSGYSEPHRHLQVCPLGEYRQTITSEIDKLVVREEKELGTEPFRVPILYRLHHRAVVIPQINPELQTVDEYSVVVQHYYDTLLKELEINPDHDSYNLIWRENWMMVVARENSKAFGKISINSFGLTGSILAMNEEIFEELQKYSPYQILMQICKGNEMEGAD